MFNRKSTAAEEKVKNMTGTSHNMLLKPLRRLLALLLCGMPLAAAGCMEVTPVAVEQLWEHYYIFLVVNAVIICAVVLPLAYVILKGKREGDEEEKVKVKTPPIEPGLTNPKEGETCPHCGAKNKKGNRNCYRCGFRMQI